jgi:hypothetical protein
MDRLNLSIVQGKTFSKVIRWEKEPFVYAAISAITKAGPARVTTTGAHGIPDGWRVAPVSAGGMRQINAANNPPKERDFKRATVISTTVVDLNTVNSSEYTTYTSGGYLQFYTPASLAGCTARLVVKNRAGGTELVRLTHLDGITLNDTDKTITVRFEAADTAGYTWSRGVYELEIEETDGTVTGLFYGSIHVTPEVATPPA